MKTNMRITYILFVLMMLPGLLSSLQAQENNVIIQGQVISSSDKLEIIGASVTEIDANNRVVNGTSTDFNGKFVMRIRSTSNRLQISYVGYNRKVLAIGDRG